MAASSSWPFLGLATPTRSAGPPIVTYSRHRPPISFSPSEAMSRASSTCAGLRRPSSVIVHNEKYVSGEPSTVLAKNGFNASVEALGGMYGPPNGFAQAVPSGRAGNLASQVSVVNTRRGGARPHSRRQTPPGARPWRDFPLVRSDRPGGRRYLRLIGGGAPEPGAP